MLKSSSYAYLLLLLFAFAVGLVTTLAASHSLQLDELRAPATLDEPTSAPAPEPVLTVTC